MLNLNEFVQVNTTKRSRTLLDKTYVKIIGDGKDTSCYLKLGKRFTKEFTDSIGHRVNVYHSPDFKRFALAFGDDRTLSTASNSGSGNIQLKTITEDFIKEHGRISRFYFDCKWETDENGNKVLLLTHNGKVEK